MDYNIAYHLHCELTLTTGRTITLVELRQRQTYAGLLEGVPWAAINDRKLQDALHDAAPLCLGGGVPYLIQPARRNYLRTPGDMNGSNALASEPAEWLPMICSTGVFTSKSAARNKKLDGSQLVAVWYQDEFGPPSDAHNLSKLQRIEWNAVAGDYEY